MLPCMYAVRELPCVLQTGATYWWMQGTILLLRAEAKVGAGCVVNCLEVVGGQKAGASRPIHNTNKM